MISFYNLFYYDDSKSFGVKFMEHVYRAQINKSFTRHNSKLKELLNSAPSNLDLLSLRHLHQ